MKRAFCFATPALVRCWFFECSPISPLSLVVLRTVLYHPNIMKLRLCQLVQNHLSKRVENKKKERKSDPAGRSPPAATATRAAGGCRVARRTCTSERHVDQWDAGERGAGRRHTWRPCAGSAAANTTTASGAARGPGPPDISPFFFSLFFYLISFIILFFYIFLLYCSRPLATPADASATKSEVQ